MGEAHENVEAGLELSPSISFLQEDIDLESLFWSENEMIPTTFDLRVLPTFQSALADFESCEGNASFLTELTGATLEQQPSHGHPQASESIQSHSLAAEPSVSNLLPFTSVTLCPEMCQSHSLTAQQSISNLLPFTSVTPCSGMCNYNRKCFY
ncbi:hypothetical protein QAD02_018157 [Eretmocerus hayati]|uniref:Uncharacterized protein n=1 Tax=Eretmocerus hayati TaxID=131215 RepID=A0ACC2PKQ4_9HYME|nr:hypothetical protein QAD02_018157 [Eretmocerus hayati]